jgi:4-hydroxybenzoate polyprenyltransferase
MPNTKVQIAVFKKTLRQYAVTLKETLIPYQIISGLAWLFVGICAASTPSKILSDPSLFFLLGAVVFARCSGMCWNRLLDATFDAQNPRTMNRAVPSGRCALHEMAFYALIFLGLFLYCCLQFSYQEAFFGFVVGFCLILYSFLKRISCLCHFFLGALYACLPMVGAFWQDGELGKASLYFAAAAFCTVCGSDILYAIQDEDVDRRLGLYSIPRVFGATKAMEIAGLLHASALVCITHALFYTQIGLVGYSVWFIGAAFLLAKWRMIFSQKEKDLSKQFPFFLIGFSTCALCSLVMDFSWKIL